MAKAHPQQYEAGLELNQYGAVESPYQGMEINQYPGGPSDDLESEKPAFHMNGHAYNEDPRSQLHRDLKTRQLTMIALGGALGTGLLINTGPYLNESGPGSMLIGYFLVGVLCYSVMAGMGEMAAWLPIPSGFTGFAHRFVDPALGFALGWNYWFKYIITTPNNIIASTLVIKYWFDQHDNHGAASHPALYVAIILVLIIAINYFGVGVFGEFEFWLSSLKILIILGLIIFTIFVASGGGDNDHPTGFHYWRHPGAFAEYPGLHGGSGQFLAFWAVLKSAVFSFLGVELVGVTVGEAQNPRKAVPRAVRMTFFRIVLFYIVLIVLLGMTVPYNSPFLLTANDESNKSVNAAASPFVVAATIAGVSSIPDIINACLLIFTFSAANSDLYIATRTLYSLAVEGNAPRIFSTTDDRGVPIYALGLSSAFCTIAFISGPVGTFKVFQYFVTLVTIFGLLTWISILISHIYFVRARKAQNVPDSALAFVSPFGATGSMAMLVFACVILVFNGWFTFLHTSTTDFDWKTFIVSYLPLPLYVVMIFGYKVFMKTEEVKPEDADLFSGKAKIDEDEAEFLAEQLRRKGGVREKKYERLYRVTLGNFF